MNAKRVSDFAVCEKDAAKARAIGLGAELLARLFDFATACGRKFHFGWGVTLGNPESKELEICIQVTPLGMFVSQACGNIWFGSLSPTIELVNGLKVGWDKNLSAAVVREAIKRAA